MVIYYNCAKGNIIIEKLKGEVIMTSTTQTYFGEDTTMFSNVDNEEFARELLARNHGFDKVPPVGMEVTDETDQSLFERFAYNMFCTPFTDIIDSVIRVEGDDIIVNIGDAEYINSEQEPKFESCLGDEDACYLKKYYKDELDAKLKGVIRRDRRNEARNSGVNIDPSKMHISEDFMEKPSVASPVKPIAAKSEKVSPMDALKKRLDSASGSTINQNAAVYSMYPFLKDLENKIKAGGVLTSSLELANGLIKVKVSSTEKPNEVIDKFSLTLDLNGYIVTQGAKWWPGVDHASPIDFQPAYKYDLKAIDCYLAGEEIPKDLLVYTDTVGELNKTVDLRTIFDIDKMTDEDAKEIMGNIQDAVKKLATKLDKECEGMRFGIDKDTYTNKDDFELVTLPNTYAYVGGDVANKGATVRIQISGKKAPKLLK